MHLHTTRTSATSLYLADDSEVIVLQHDGIVVQLALPVKVASLPGKSLTISNTNSYEMTLRLQPESNALTRLLDIPSDDAVPWSASMLQDCVDVRCLKCTSTIVDSLAVKTWQDLPSANWAEMMDFWHCHKPIDHKHGQQDGHGKGYGADNVLTARQGAGFVDVTTMLLCPEDCHNIKVCRHYFLVTEVACTS